MLWVLATRTLTAATASPIWRTLSMTQEADSGLSVDHVVSLRQKVPTGVTMPKTFRIAMTLVYCQGTVESCMAISTVSAMSSPFLHPCGQG